MLESVSGALQFSEASFLEVTVEGDGHLDLSDFDVAKHAGVLLDGVGDTLLLKQNRETLQGRPKILKGGRSQTMRYAYPFTLARRAVVATMDLSALNMDALRTDHWLCNPLNVKVLRLDGPAWQGAPSIGVSSPASGRDAMFAWTAGQVFEFFKSSDLEGPARVLFSNGVRGKDLLAVSFDDLQSDLRLSKLASRNIVAVRDEYLASHP